MFLIFTSGIAFAKRVSPFAKAISISAIQHTSALRPPLAS
jgi:hypothetical protein